METSWHDLVLDTGELVRIEYPDKVEDEFFESIENAMKRRDWWSSEQWEGCTATFMGLDLDRVNMGRVVGAL